MKQLEKFVPNKTTTEGITQRTVYNEEYKIVIDTTNVWYIQKEGGGHSYTFEAFDLEGYYGKEGELKNMVINYESKDSSYSRYVLSYNISDEELLDWKQGFKSFDFVKNTTFFKTTGDSNPMHLGGDDCWEEIIINTVVHTCASGLHVPCEDCDYLGTPFAAYNEIVKVLFYSPDCLESAGGGGSSGGSGGGLSPGEEGNQPTNPGGGNNNNDTPDDTPHNPEFTDQEGDPIMTTPVKSFDLAGSDESEDDDCNTSKEDLKLVFPNTPDNVLEEIANYINQYGQDFGIDTKEKLQHFLAQAGHESTNYAGIAFGAFEENLNYRVNKLGTSDYWNKYFNTTENPTENPNKANPNDFVNPANPTYVNKEMFANYVYNDAYRSQKAKLGNVNTGDGYKYRGRGIIQLTGRSNYTAFNTFYQENYDDSVNLLNNPELVASDIEIAVISALWFFKNNVVDKISGGIDENTTVKSVSILVNGGDTGLKHRKELHESTEENIDCL